MKWPLLALLLVAIVGLAAAACGDDDDANSVRTSAPAAPGGATSSSDATDAPRNQLRLMVLPRTTLGLDSDYVLDTSDSTGFDTNAEEISKDCDSIGRQKEIEQSRRVNGYSLSFLQSAHIDSGTGIFAVQTGVEYYHGEPADLELGLGVDDRREQLESGKADCHGLLIYTLSDFPVTEIGEKAIGVFSKAGDEQATFYLTFVGFTRGHVSATVSIGDYDAVDHSEEVRTLAAKLDDHIQAVLSGQETADPLAGEAIALKDCKTALDVAPEAQVKTYPKAPAMTIDVTKKYKAIVHTVRGDFTMELRPDLAAQHVNSFIFLAKDGFFNGVTFHRVIPGFVAQTGDPTGSGSGGPGYTVPLEPSTVPFTRGVVGMARSSDPNSAGSQWFVTYADASNLNGAYTVFGTVTDGMDVVDCITPRDPSRNPNAPPGDAIVSIDIEE